ncbi:MAG: DUF1922 domain-containing protein [archaeon]|nr:DUF1922 domain-containing protein [archaeon]
MYVIFRCDCGRVLYAKKGVASRKCTCGKTIKVKTRRILKKVETAQDASEAVQKMQEEIYGGTIFRTAQELKEDTLQNRLNKFI